MDATVDATAAASDRSIAMLSFQRLDAYQRAIELLALVYDIVDVLREDMPVVQNS